ncbi:ABC transporter permease [Segetibacter sp. 3557_3]|uniref:FtsX-like permease family protein n=1 Tax=Segetibacter sp. 3557_3 TaxID=2547429 RepID=UPI001058F73F|nr:FtsX-like permease family protein [Segetibacter sp. 3557_3]TDH26108.1 ABC transporter permease [Segetibacter sp. 3557_3]
MTLLFAWRYFKAKKSTNAINIISWISVLAIAVGAAALIVVLSVFNGFEGLVKGLYADFYADVRVSAKSGKFITLTPAQLNTISTTPGVKGLTLTVEEKAVLVNNEYQSIVYLKGVDDAYPNVSGLPSHIIKGTFDRGTVKKPALVIGTGIENAIGADPGKNIRPLTVYLPNRQSTSTSISEALNSFNVMVSGSFAIQQDFDNKYALTNIGFLKYMLDLQPNEFTSAEVKLRDPSQMDLVKNRIQKRLGPNFMVETRYQQNQSLYSVMQVEKWVIYCILSLILMVAAFNMIGALTMLVLEKQKDISVLQAMGASRGYIQKIFLSEGFVIAIIGGGSGILLAVLVCFLQIKYHLIKLEGGSFIIDYYPVKMVAQDFLLVITTVLVIALLAAWLPARKASKQTFSLKS